MSCIFQYRTGPTSTTEATLAVCEFVLFGNLWARGVNKPLAPKAAGSSHGPWHIANSPALSSASPIAYFDALGVPRLCTGPWLNSIESPDAEPHVRWSGREREATLPLIPIPFGGTDAWTRRFTTWNPIRKQRWAVSSKIL